MSDFVHLHLHSQYSLLDGANRIKDVTRSAAEAGMPAMALTDHGNMFGAIDFYNHAKKAGVKPILGIEAYTTPGNHRDRDPRFKSNNHLVLLARNETGYKNLIKLSTEAYLHGFYYKPRMDKKLLREHSEGVIALSACLKGEINEAITQNREHEAEASVREMLDIFGKENFYLELQDHDIPEQAQANDVLRKFARKHDVEMVVTNDCHYLEKSDAHPHDILLCIGTQRMVADTDRMKYSSQEFYLKSAEEIKKRFPKDSRAIENTVAIAERCELVIETGNFHLPEFPVPHGSTLDSYFADVCRAGLEERLAELEKRGSRGLARHGEAIYRQRLETEIDIIRKMGFPGYFLITWDFIRHAREEDIPVGPGRGSAAGSLVSYVLRITDIDPLEYDLLFERFLNPERVSMPDIDIDFCMRRRGEVLDYVTEKYGRDKVAQIITFGTLAAKAVIRDVGRVLGLPYAQVDKIAKLIPDMTRDLEEVAKEGPLADEMRRDREVREIVQVGRRLCGLTRHASVHAAGVVITPKPLSELVPLYRVKKGDTETITTQWDKDIVESLGLLKMDFLGLRTLTVIDDTLKLVRAQGVDLDLDEIPLDDPEVYRLFCEGRTNGIFQFESRGMKDLLRRAQPSKFEDLAAFNALYRPGALSVGMVDEYIERKLGNKRVAYILPVTREILEETYGVIVYQEQVMQIAVVVAGFTMGEADVLRKAMGKKKLDVMAKMKEKFMDGAHAQGHDRKKAGELWDYIEPFAGYGFNKSHSVAYAMLAYKTAYLKVHHPVAFMAAMLNSELSSSDTVDKYLRECRDMGIGVLPPDVNQSDWGFTVVDGNVRFGLGAVKGVGESAVESLVKARKRLGQFKGLAQLAVEVDLRLANSKFFECLIKGGCFDAMLGNRAALMSFLDAALSYAQKRRREIENGQGTLFGGAASFEPIPDERVPEWSETEKLSHEKDALGFYLTGNPLSAYTRELAKRCNFRVCDLAEAAENGFEAPPRVGGLVTRLRHVKIKSGMNEGKMMARFILEDLTGTLPVVLFARQTEQFGRYLEEERVVVCSGQVRERGGDLEMNLDELTVVENPADRPAEQLLITLSSRLSLMRMQELKDLLIERHGRTPVSLRVSLPGQVVCIAPGEQYKVDVDEELLSAVEALTGPETVLPIYPPAPPMEPSESYSRLAE